MVKREIIKVKKVLIKLFREIGINVEKIVIFGSYAKGRDRKDSDVDIIVVSKEFRGKDIFEIVYLTKDIHWKLVEKITKPFDIMYYSDMDWANGKSLIINEAREKGEVIYDARFY